MVAMVDVHPLTPERWDDFAALFGPNGATSGCWCMWWRVTAKEFEAGTDVNRERVRALVEGGDHAPGLLAYDGDRAVGWCSVSPRPEFGRIERSPDLALFGDDGDDSGSGSGSGSASGSGSGSGEVWSVPCFYIGRRERGRGIARALLDAAVAYAADHGATVVEGYAVDPSRRKFTNSELYTGTVSLFEAAGFERAGARKPTSRVVMRRRV